MDCKKIIVKTNELYQTRAMSFLFVHLASIQVPSIEMVEKCLLSEGRWRLITCILDDEITKEKVCFFFQKTIGCLGWV